jgi:predicted nuclease with TOPRIM domain
VTLTPEIIALLSAIFGGAGLKLLERFFSHADKAVDEAAAIRKELRDEATGMRIRLDKLEAEIDDWRQKYYKMVEENAKLRADNEALMKRCESMAFLLGRLRKEVAILKGLPVENGETGGMNGQ